MENTLEIPVTGGTFERTRVSTLLALSWLIAAAALLVALFVIAPGRGAGWSVDDGLFLANAWSVVHGGQLDRMLPQEPVYLVNALWMKLGVRELLHFRYIYYGLSFLSAIVFLVGLDRRHLASPLVPVAVTAALTIAFSSVLPFYFFFLFGAGCYFFSVSAKGRTKELLLALGGLFFAIAGFMHVAFLIAMVLLVCILLFADRSIRKSSFAPCFVFATFALWGLYLGRLGVGRFLTAPAGHDASAHHLMMNIKPIIWYFCSAALVYTIVSMVLFWLGRNRYAFAQIMIGSFITAQSAFGLIRSEVNLLSGAIGPSDLLRPMLEATAAIYGLLLVVFFRWAGELIYDSGFDGRLPRQKANWIISQIHESGDHRKLLAAICGLFLVTSGYAAGSNSDFTIVLSAFGAPALAATVILWRPVENRNWSAAFSVLNGAMLVVWLAIFGGFAVTMNLPTMTPIIAHGRIRLQQSPLVGIDEQPEYARVLHRLGELYETNGCKKLSFVTLDYIPMVYFILSRSPPDEFGVVRPSFYFPEGSILQELNLQKGWCVLDATAEETRSLINSRGFDIRERVRKHVQENSQKVFDIPSPNVGVGPLRLYVRDAPTP